MRIIPLLTLLVSSISGLDDQFQCDQKAVLGRLLRSAYSRLIAVHCATGDNETKTKRLSLIDSPLEANAMFCNDKLDMNQIHQTLFDMQLGLQQTKTQINYFDGAKRSRSNIGSEIYENYADQVCLDWTVVLGKIENDLSRYRDQSDNYRKLFGIHEKHDELEHTMDIQQKLIRNTALYNIYNTVETLSEDLTDVTDLKQIFNIVKSAQDGTQVWIVVASEMLINQSFAKATAGLAQTKDNEINVILIDSTHIPQNVKAIWRSLAKSTHGKLYQATDSILNRLAPLVSDTTSAKYQLLEEATDMFSLTVDVDSSVEQLMIEVTSGSAPTLTLLTPEGELMTPHAVIDFISLKYYTINAPASGKWEVRINESDSQVHTKVSCLATVGFKTQVGSDNMIRTHSLSSAAGGRIGLNDRNMNNEAGHFVSSYVNGTLGETRITLHDDLTHLHRLRRSTQPIFTKLSNNTELVPGRTNVIFLRAHTDGQQLQFSAVSSNNAWRVDLSPETSNRVETDLILTIKVPFHSKAGASGAVTVVASNAEVVVGSKRIDLFITEELVPETRSINVDVKINNRFASTKVTFVTENHSDTSREAPFRAIVPSRAFVKAFKVITADGREYTSRIVSAHDEPSTHLKFAWSDPHPQATEEQLKRAEASTPLHHMNHQEAMIVDVIPVVAPVYEATEVAYNQTETKKKETTNRIVQVRQAGQHLLVHATVEAFSNVTYQLEYVEVLERQRDSYRYNVAFDSELPAKDLDINIEIRNTEPGPIKYINAAPRQSAAVRSETRVKYGDGRKDCVIFTSLKFSPKFRDDRFWFGIDYDIVQNGCATVSDSTHFITRCRPGRNFHSPMSAPSQFGVNIIFVIDGSGSMWGERIEHARKAFKFMIEDLRPGLDTFNIIIYDDKTKIFSNEKMVTVNDRSIYAALQFLDQIRPGGGTNTYGALVKALIVLSEQKNRKANTVMFLTDGAPTVGVVDQNTIVNTVLFVARQNRISVNSIAFGAEVNYEFLTQISAQTNGMILKVPVRPDSAFMMQDFYFETVARLQRHSGTQLPHLSLSTDDTVVPYTEYLDYNKISYGEELILTGTVPNSNAFKLNAVVSNDLSTFNLNSQHQLDSNCSDYHGAILAHAIISKRQIAYDEEYERLTEQLVATSIVHNLLTPAVSLEIQKPSRNRRSTTPVREVKYRFRRLTRPTKRIEMNNQLVETLEEPVEQPIIKFTEKMAIVNSNNEQICFELSERDEHDALILLRTEKFMAVAMVNENGISQINLHDGGSTLMVITPSGVLGRNYRLNNSNFVQYNDRVVFLLKNGLKFEVTWNRLTRLSLNILRLGQGSTGLVSTLASLNAHVSNDERVQDEVPVEIQDYFAMAKIESTSSGQCIMIGDLEQFLSEVEETGQAL